MITRGYWGRNHYWCKVVRSVGGITVVWHFDERVNAGIAQLLDTDVSSIAGCSPQTSWLIYSRMPIDGENEQIKKALHGLMKTFPKHHSNIPFSMPTQTFPFGGGLPNGDRQYPSDEEKEVLDEEKEVLDEGQTDVKLESVAKPAKKPVNQKRKTRKDPTKESTNKPTKSPTKTPKKSVKKESAKKPAKSPKNDLANKKKPKWKGYVLLKDVKEAPVEEPLEEKLDVRATRAKRQRLG
ncbi:hypothetical protein DFH28DRAFT_1118493 [Melampsora americana]|nr:hypothetical protein DFH28DRAFT_1118493 [Melampsora americana]